MLHGKLLPAHAELLDRLSPAFPALFDTDNNYGGPR
jgi:hypothetical protein